MLVVLISGVLCNRQPWHSRCLYPQYSRKAEAENCPELAPTDVCCVWSMMIQVSRDLEKVIERCVSMRVPGLQHHFCHLSAIDFSLQLGKNWIKASGFCLKSSSVVTNGPVLA